MKQLIKRYRSHLMYHKISMVLVIVGAASFIIVPVLLSLLPQGYFFPLFLAYLAFIAALFINLGVSSSVVKKSERGLMHKIWAESDSSIQAREQMEKYGVRVRSADEFIFSKQRLAELNANRRKEEEFAENAYIESQRLLAEVSVPEHCNIIPIMIMMIY